MSELFSKIYDQVVTYEKDWVEISRHAERKTDECIRDYSDLMDEESIGKLRGDFIDVAVLAEREAFYLGMQYAFRLFLEMAHQ